jgi:hypothetical protein
MALRSESVVTESGWMMSDLRSTWHPGGMVIDEEEQIVMEVKVEGHLIVVEKSDDKEMITLLLFIWKTCS